MLLKGLKKISCSKIIWMLSWVVRQVTFFKKLNANFQAIFELQQDVSCMWNFDIEMLEYIFGNHCCIIQCLWSAFNVYWGFFYWRIQSLMDTVINVGELQSDLDLWFLQFAQDVNTVSLSTEARLWDKSTMLSYNNNISCQYSVLQRHHLRLMKHR